MSRVEGTIRGERVGLSQRKAIVLAQEVRQAKIRERGRLPNGRTDAFKEKRKVRNQEGRLNREVGGRSTPWGISRGVYLGDRGDDHIVSKQEGIGSKDSMAKKRV